MLVTIIFQVRIPVVILKGIAMSLGNLNSRYPCNGEMDSCQFFSSSPVSAGVAESSLQGQAAKQRSDLRDALMFEKKIFSLQIVIYFLAQFDQLSNNNYQLISNSIHKQVKKKSN